MAYVIVCVHTIKCIVSVLVSYNKDFSNCGIAICDFQLKNVLKGNSSVYLGREKNISIKKCCIVIYASCNGM